jgi:hypothetical protein
MHIIQLYFVLTTLPPFEHLTTPSAPLVLHANSWIGRLGMLLLRFCHAAGGIFALGRLAAAIGIVCSIGTISSWYSRHCSILFGSDLLHAIACVSTLHVQLIALVDLVLCVFVIWYCSEKRYN